MEICFSFRTILTTNLILLNVKRDQEFPGRN